jgi:hypothetical protein
MAEPCIGVVIVHHRNPQLTSECLDHLLQSTEVILQIRLIDNSDQGDAPSPNLPPGGPTFSHAFKMLRTSNLGFRWFLHLGSGKALHDTPQAMHEREVPGSIHM